MGFFRRGKGVQGASHSPLGLQTGREQPVFEKTIKSDPKTFSEAPALLTTRSISPIKRLVDWRPLALSVLSAPDTNSNYQTALAIFKGGRGMLLCVAFHDGLLISNQVHQRGLCPLQCSDEHGRRAGLGDLV